MTDTVYEILKEIDIDDGYCDSVITPLTRAPFEVQGPGIIPLRACVLVSPTAAVYVRSGNYPNMPTDYRHTDKH